MENKEKETDIEETKPGETKEKIDATPIDSIEEKIEVVVKKKEEQTFLEKVEQAAKKGSAKGSTRSLMISVVIVIVLGLFVGFEIYDSNNKVEKLFTAAQFEDHDAGLEDNGFLGYTAADFEDAVVGSANRLQKLEVYQQTISDVVTITDAGLFGWEIFDSTQLVTFNGVAIYSIDLAQINGKSISVDNDKNVVTITIPHAAKDAINIDENQMEVCDTKKGFLRFSEVKLTVESLKTIQSKAREKMEAKFNRD